MLVRVELNSHHNLRCVSKSWNTALKSPHFYQERKRLNISEQRVCIVEEIDGVGNRVAVFYYSCKSLPPIPREHCCIFHCHFVKQKLVLITGSNVRLYDFACSKWQHGAKMPVWQDGSAFASAADLARGLIYVGGGYNLSLKSRRLPSKPICSGFVYNVERDKWDDLPDMNTPIRQSRGAFADGNFFVIGSSPTFEVFDSYARSWKTLENRFHSLHFIMTFGRFYCLSGRGLIEYDYSQDKLHIVGPLPTEDWCQSINFAVVVSNKIFVHKEEPNGGQYFYMLSPSTQIGGTLNLMDIRRPTGLQGRHMRAAATLEF